MGRGLRREEEPASAKKPASKPAPKQAAEELPAAARTLFRLQSTVGNAAVNRMLGASEARSRPKPKPKPTSPEQMRDAQNGTPLGALARAVLQRVKIGAGFEETLLQGGGGGTYTPTKYTIESTSTYDLKRSSTQVSASVKIFFRDPGGGVIPERDRRRAWAKDICTKLVAHWNGRFALTNLPPAGTKPKKGLFSKKPVALPLNFVATPVFDPKAENNATVDLHARAADPTTGDTVRPGGHPIDAGNWYTSSGTSYGTIPQDAIYAHEYGHLLGIPDEYSISNAEMHKALHGLDTDPAGRKEKDAALDTAGARQIILQALAPKLFAEIGKIAGAVGEVMAGQKRQLARLLGEGLKKTFRNTSLHDVYTGVLDPQLAAQPRPKKRLKEAVRFEAAENMSYRDIADKAILASFSEGSMEKLLQAVFINAMEEAIRGGEVVDIPYLSGGDKKKVTVEIATTGVMGADPLLDKAAADMAAATTGKAVDPGPKGKRPPTVYPSNTLIGQLTELPAKWKGVADLLDTQVSAMEAWALMLGVPALGAPPFDPKNSVRALYRELLKRFTAISEGVATAAIQSFITDQVTPHIKGQIDEIIGLVKAEADKHYGVSGTGTTGSPGSPPDPEVLDAAKRLHERADAMQKASATTTTDTPHIRYTVQSMMGSNHKGTDIRLDQMAKLAENFNAKLKKWGEDDFRAEAAGP